MPEKLKFWCSPRPFRVPDDLPCHRETVGHLDIFEYRTGDEEDPYALQMESQVETQDDLRNCRSQALGLARDLDRVWPYAAGVGLFPPRTTMHVSRTPLGWSSNANQLDAILPGITFGLTIAPTVSEFAVVLPYMPLKPALEALRAYRGADPMTLALIDLHFQALANDKSDAGLFILAKSHELAAALLPGRTFRQKQSTLDPHYVREFQHSMDWLKRMANTRSDIRHVVASKDPTTFLHPRLTLEERRDFFHDADCVIRAVIARRLGIKIPTLNRR